MTTVVDAEVQLTVVSDAAGRMRVQATGFQFDAGRAVAIEDTVGKVAGVQAVHAYPRTASIVIWYSRAICDTAAILSAIIDAETVPAAAVPAYASRSASNRKAGVVQKIIDWSTRTLSGVRRDVAAQPSGETSDACCDGEDNEDREPEQLWQVAKLRRAAFSGVLLTASLVAAWAYPLWPVVLGLKALALAVGASTFVPSSLKRLAEGRVGVGTLMTIAALGAVALGELGEAATLAFLFSISEGLEEYATARTRRGLRALLSLVPDQATVLREGTETIVASTELHVGDQMIVKPGERLATDGIIRAGRTALDVSAITGESVPVEVGPGDEVFAGSINGLGVLQVGVTATAANNSLARIVHIVEAEQVRKGASQRLADCIARPLVPSIMIAAALIAGTGSVLGNPLVWIERALVVLVAAAPCALAIAVPVTVVMLTGDNHATAAALAAQAGIEQVHAELRPEDKAHLVAQLRARQPTAMVGDGVNDAPALAAADLGIAMGAMGTDVAIETADVALMGQDLRHLPQALDHARRSRQIMVQNVGLSLSIITVLMPLALFGILGLAAVVLVHEFTEVIVIANGVRAGRIKPLAGPPKTPDRTIPG